MITNKTGYIARLVVLKLQKSMLFMHEYVIYRPVLINFHFVMRNGIQRKELNDTRDF